MGPSQSPRGKQMAHSKRIMQGELIYKGCNYRGACRGD